MLALTRKVGESIVIGGNIVVTIVDIKGDNVRLGIDAAKEIKIYRGEIYNEIVAENKLAVAPVNLDQMDKLKGIGKDK